MKMSGVARLELSRKAACVSIMHMARKATSCLRVATNPIAYVSVSKIAPAAIEGNREVMYDTPKMS